MNMIFGMFYVLYKKKIYIYHTLAIERADIKRI